MIELNKLKLEECFYYFQSYVEMYSGGRFNGFENNYFLKKEEVNKIGQEIWLKTCRKLQELRSEVDR